jgi:hypothetical protein
VRKGMRLPPWALAVVGLAVPLAGSGFSLWIPLGLWAVGLGAFWVVGRIVQTTRDQRIAVGLILLPLLFVAAFEGGWWLIPADLAWIAVEWKDRSRPAGPIATGPSA